MSLILNIDTCTAIAHVSVSRRGEVVSVCENKIQKDHAAFLHTAIKELLNVNGINNDDIAAVAVTAGPGSYTGIRIGMAAAKGFCLALNKPLILINSLELIARDISLHNDFPINDNVLICPMIDARRMEVFTALYDLKGQEVMAPHALILTPDSFDAHLQKHSFFYVGDGAAKWRELNDLGFHLIRENVNVPLTMAKMSYEKVLLRAFTDTAYSEPVYLKGLYEG